MTLFEVLLALAIFLGALTALAQVISTGTQSANHTRLQTEAVLRCEAKLAEMLAGVEPLQAVPNTGFEDSPQRWNWSAEISEGPHPELIGLEVTVAHVDSNDVVDMTFSLRRWLRDPQVFIDAAEMNAAQESQP